MVSKIPLTVEGFKQLEEELKILKTVERPNIIEAIATAREHGDLKENAEYHAARERQSFIEGRILEVQGTVSLAEVIDPAKMSGDTIKFGASIKIVDEDSDEEYSYQIVGEQESDFEKGKLALTAPISRALIGKGVGDCVKVKTPKGSKSYEVLEVVYK